ncbi:Ctr copper transporter [Auriculariales sp. MPI-PUGE-AT-0066]|nr:Ctr copper transporter [Auriculariales sp. MPI-PUGE-AT-0066]
MDHSHHAHHHHHEHGAENLLAAAKRCSMHMLWNTQIEDTCIVFRSWHVQSNTDFIIALVVVAGFGVLYEWLRVVQVNYDRRVAARLAVSKGPISIAQSRNLSKVPMQQRLARAGLYGSAVFLSFFIMLIFMTYNAYLIGAVVVGAAAGHFIFSAEMDTGAVLSASGVNGKGVSCH